MLILCQKLIEKKFLEKKPKIEIYKFLTKEFLQCAFGC